MSEETKNENNEEIEETSEGAETEEEVVEHTDSDSEAEESESSDESEEDASDEDDSDEDASEEDDSDEDDSDEDASEEDDSDEDDSEEEASDEDDSEEEASDEDDSEEEASDEDDSEEEASDEDDSDEEASDEETESIDVEAGELSVQDGEEDPHVGLLTGNSVEGVAAFFDHPDHLLFAAAQTRDSTYEAFDAFSPFPIHGMDDALGVGRSWIPWVTFGAGCAGFSTAVGLQFGIMGFDWPMNYGGKPFIAWPSFVPIMFELTVLFAGVITGLVMLKASGCFQKPFIIDREITNDRFVLWISATDDNFDRDGVIEFMKELNPSEIRTIKKDA